MFSNKIEVCNKPKTGKRAYWITEDGEHLTVAKLDEMLDSGKAIIVPEFTRDFIARAKQDPRFETAKSLISPLVERRRAAMAKISDIRAKYKEISWDLTGREYGYSPSTRWQDALSYIDPNGILGDDLRIAQDLLERNLSIGEIKDECKRIMQQVERFESVTDAQFNEIRNAIDNLVASYLASSEAIDAFVETTEASIQAMMNETETEENEMTTQKNNTTLDNYPSIKKEFDDLEQTVTTKAIEVISIKHPSRKLTENELKREIGRIFPRTLAWIDLARREMIDLQYYQDGDVYWKEAEYDDYDRLVEDGDYWTGVEREMIGEARPEWELFKFFEDQWQWKIDDAFEVESEAYLKYADPQRKRAI